MWEIIEIKRLLDWFDNNCDASIRAELVEDYLLIFDISKITAEKFNELTDFLNSVGLKWDIVRKENNVYLLVENL